VVHKEGIYSFNCGWEVLFDSVLEAVPNCRGWAQNWKPGFADKATGSRTASVPLGMSYGEQISIQITENPPGIAWLAILSTSNFGLFDFGKNSRNIDKLIAATERALAGKGIAVRAALQQAAPAQGAVSAEPPRTSSPSFCTQCGASPTPGAKFCQKCGSPL